MENFGKNDKTVDMPWMKKVSKQLREQITNVKQLNITEKTLEKETKKWENWTAPGIDAIQNFWRKRLKSARTALKRASEQIKDNNNLITVWQPPERSVSLPKIKDLIAEKNYCPKTCFNTSYNLLTGLAGKYMREHAMENYILDEGQLGAVDGVLGTVDQLIIDYNGRSEDMSLKSDCSIL